MRLYLMFLGQMLPEISFESKMNGPNYSLHKQWTLRFSMPMTTQFTNVESSA